MTEQCLHLPFGLVVVAVVVVVVVGGYQEGWHGGNKELLVSLHTAEYDAHPSYLISNILDGFIAEGHLCLTAPLTCLAV